MIIDHYNKIIPILSNCFECCVHKWIWKCLRIHVEKGCRFSTVGLEKASREHSSNFSRRISIQWMFLYGRNIRTSGNQYNSLKICCPDSTLFTAFIKKSLLSLPSRSYFDFLYCVYRRTSARPGYQNQQKDAPNLQQHRGRSIWRPGQRSKVAA